MFPENRKRPHPVRQLTDHPQGRGAGGEGSCHPGQCVLTSNFIIVHKLPYATKKGNRLISWDAGLTDSASSSGISLVRRSIGGLMGFGHLCRPEARTTTLLCKLPRLPPGALKFGHPINTSIHRGVVGSVSSVNRFNGFPRL